MVVVVSRLLLLLAGAAVPWLSSLSARADPFCRDRAAFVVPPRQRVDAVLETAAAASTNRRQTLSSSPPSVLRLLVRGGATLEEDEESEGEDEEEFKDAVEVMEKEDEEEEEEEELSESEEVEAEEVSLDASLAAAALKSSSKMKAKAASSKVQTAKKAVNTQLMSESSSTAAKTSTTATKPPKKKSSSKLFHLPYIVRALLNPRTVWAMTRAYWASLFDLDYLQSKQPAATELRSALEEKAKRSGGSAKKGRRRMKRGQAKTLADLPQLST